MPPSAVLKLAKSIPPFPAAIAQLRDATDLEVDEALRIVSCDPALAARVLKVSNSSFYGRRGRVASLREAVILLGVRTLRNLALGLGVVQLRDRWSFPTALKEFQVRYWRSSIASSVAASSIAQSLRLRSRDECFAAGLVRGVGQLGMMRALGADYAAFLSKESVYSERLAQLETETFGYSHLDLGRMMCVEWKLPELLTDVVSDSAPGSELGRVVSLGRALAQFAGFGGLGSESLPLTELASLLGRDPDSLSEIMEQLPGAVEEAATTLEIAARPDRRVAAKPLDVAVSDPAGAHLVRLAVRGLGCAPSEEGAGLLVGDGSGAQAAERPLALDLSSQGLRAGELAVGPLYDGLRTFLGGSR